MYEGLYTYTYHDEIHTTRIIENHKKPSENAEKEEESNKDLKMIFVVYRI